MNPILKSFRSISLLALISCVPTLYAAASATDDLKARITTLEFKLEAIQTRLDKLENKGETKPSAVQPQTQIGPAPTPSPISVVLIKKSLEQTEPSASTTKQISLMLLFKNSSGKDIVSFTGVMHFFDLTKKELISFELPLEQVIPNGKESSWLGQLDAVPALGNYAGFLNLENINIISEYWPKRIVFSDGSQQIFESK